MNAPLHHPPKRPQQLSSRRDPAAVAAAFAALVEALGLGETADAQTPGRAASLWLEHLTRHEGHSCAEALGDVLPAAHDAPIVLGPMGFHLVCPHHLTVASGAADVAFWPKAHIVGFGRIAQLVSVATARLALQEDATTAIAQALMQQLQPKAVAVRLRAEHLCHTVLYPRSQGAKATTWSLLGEPASASALQQLVGP